ncbi:hypothetical protein Trydic_g16210 [Trypoxylus dichotomus]
MKAEALANTFAVHCLPNHRNDPDQESMVLNTLREIDEIYVDPLIVISPRSFRGGQRNPLWKHQLRMTFRAEL